MVGTSIKDRYAVKAILGQGGMGVVYHAYDSLMRRDVALKTLRDVPSSTFLDLFSRECSVLAGMVHPNIVEIFDMGEFEEDGVAKPYFVMPLLPGGTLHELIYPSAIPLSETRCVDIIAQVCRGLQAAHERDLLHRDIKPRNIFVMRDDAVKVIDFGVAHLMGGNFTGVRGTPQYMSPEQISFKPLNNRSDIFSLAVVCYEALTASHPFLRRADRRDSEEEIVRSILKHVPPVASELNPSVSRSVAQVVAKGMAKDAGKRFETAASFAEALQKALRNDNSVASSAAVRTRLERARRSFEQNDLQFASEIVGQLEAEGHSDAEIAEFRKELDDAVERERIERLIAAASRCFVDEEYYLALQKSEEVLEIDESNVVALNMKKRIQSLLTEQKMAELLRVAAGHLGRSEFTDARQAVQDALKLRPSDTQARELLSEVDSKQKEVLRQRQEQERLYQSAQAAFFVGKIELAIENLDRLERLTAQSGEIRDRIDDYKELYRRVRAEYDALKAALAQANSLLDHDLSAAQKICDRYLAKYADQPDFIALAQEIGRRREEAAEVFRKNIANRVENEDNLDSRVRILEDALKTRPKDEYFLHEIQSLREISRKVVAIADKARALERQRDFSGAIGEWENLRSVYPRFPGLSDEITRARNSFQKQRFELKAIHLKKIESALQTGSYNAAGKLLEEAGLEFPSDSEIAALSLRRDKQIERVGRVDFLIKQALRATEQQKFEETVLALAEAGEVSGEVMSLKRSVFQASLDQAEALASADWRTAKTILEQTAKLDPQLPVPARFWEAVLQRESDEDVLTALSGASVAEKAGDLLKARAILQESLEKHAREPRLQNGIRSLEKALLERRRREEREKDLQSMRGLRDEFRQTEMPGGLRNFIVRSKALAERYGKDAEFTSIAFDISREVEAFESAADAMSRNDLEDCLRICTEILAVDSDHRLFLNLRAQAETREREKATEFLEQVAHSLAVEPDLHAREKILEEALRQYPNEQYFADELGLVRNEERIIQSTADRAQTLEEKGFLWEALEQWTHLKNLYPLYPGVDGAIARCNKLIQKKRAEAQATLLAAVKKATQSRDYDSAAELLREAQTEYPENPELPALADSISKHRELRAQALSLFKQGEASFVSGQFQFGHKRILQALRVGENEPDIPRLVAALLVRYAGEALATDLAIAEAMVADAKIADPAASIPKDLERSLLAARSQRDFDEYQQAARSLEENGNPAEALKQTRDFLEKYPGQSKALASQERLLNAIEARDKRDRREQQLSDLRSFQAQANTVTQVANLLDLVERTQLIARRNPDVEVTQVAEQVGQALLALAEIQKFVDAGQLKEALDLCVRSAAEFPQDSTFANWRDKIELRQSEQSRKYLSEVIQQLALEPNLDKQEQILNEAVRLYPGEPYYAAELTQVRNNQVTLDVGIARVRDLEGRELYEDALREWEGLRNSYPWRDFDGEIDRVRSEWEARNTALRNKWQGRISESLAAGDVERAASILLEASVELADDPVLSDLDTQIENVRRAQIRRQELVSSAGDSFRRSRFAEGAELLRAATGIFNEDSNFRGLAVELILKEARSSVENDWRGSEILLNTMSQIDPTCEVPVDLLESIRISKREAEIVDLLGQIDRAESRGDLNGAKELADRGKTKFPDEARIDQRLQAVSIEIRELEIQQAREQARQQALDVRSRLEYARTKRQVAKLRSSYIARSLIESPDLEVRQTVTQLLEEIDEKEKALETTRQKQSHLRRFWYVPVLLLVLVGALTSTWFLRKPKIKAIAVVEVAPAPAKLSNSAIRIAGTLEAGDVYLDDAKVGALNSGSEELSGLAPGSHVLKIKSAEGEASIPLFQDGLSAVRISAPIIASGVSVAVLATNDQGGTLTTSSLETKAVSVDKVSAGSTQRGSLALPTLTSGNHHLEIGASSDALSFDVSTRPTSPLYVFIAGGAQTGTLDVTTNVSGVSLFINDRKYSAEADNSFRLKLPVGLYDVYATRDGYAKSENAHVDLAKGSQIGVNLHLTPKPAVLEISSGTPGIAIKMDGVEFGDLAVGKSRSRNIPAGTHVFEISRQGFVPKSLRRVIEPGQTVTLTNSDLSLSPAAPDAAAREAEDWQRVTTSGGLADLQGFRLRYPNGPHAPAASEKIQQLEWSGVDKTSPAALSGYIAKYPETSHGSEVRQLIEQLAAAERDRTEKREWDSLDKKNKDDLRAFMTKYPNSIHSSAAQQRLTDISKQETVVEAQTLDETAWKSVKPNDRSSLERYLSQFPSGRHASEATAGLSQRSSPEPDSASVLPILQKYAAAWNAKDLETIFSLHPTLNKRSVKAQLAPVRVWRMTITPLAAPQVSGDTASVICRRKVEQVFSDGTEKQPPESTVTFVLKRQGASWTIESVR